MWATGISSIDAKKRVQIATWNIRSLKDTEKMKLLVSEMRRLQINIMGLSEIWIKGNGSLDIEDYTILLSNEEDGSTGKGVGIVIDKRSNTH